MYLGKFNVKREINSHWVLEKRKYVALDYYFYLCDMCQSFFDDKKNLDQDKPHFCLDCKVVHGRYDKEMYIAQKILPYKSYNADTYDIEILPNGKPSIITIKRKF